jgi:curved DNA-binding protein
MAEDYYKILGVTRDSSDQEIKKSYRNLAMQYHPDRNPGNEQWAHHKFKEINEAYGVLGDREKRRQYDQFGVTGNIGDIFGSASTRMTFEDLMREFNGAGLGFGFLDEVFGDLIRGKGGAFSFRTSTGPGGSIRFETWPSDRACRTRERPHQAQRARKQDVHYELMISKDEASMGTQKLLKRNTRSLEVRIPSGVKTGNILRLRNACRVTDGHPGDILVRVRVK